MNDKTFINKHQRYDERKMNMEIILANFEQVDIDQAVQRLADNGIKFTVVSHPEFGNVLKVREVDAVKALDVISE